MKRFIEKYSFQIVLLIAAFLRLFKIGERDFWYDEAFTGIALKESFSGMMKIIIQDVHPPLYYLTVKVFASFFQYSVFGIRFYSAIFGILGVWIVYVFAKELFNKKAAFWASLITAISPFAIQYSQEARMYSMFGFLILTASLFFIRGLKSKKRNDYVLWGVFLGLAYLTHYMGLIFSPTYFFVFILWKKYEKKKWDIRKLKNLKPLFLGYSFAALLFLPWINFFYTHLLKSGGGLFWITPATLGSFITNVRIFIFGTPLGEMTGQIAGMPIPNEFYFISSNTIFLSVTALLFCVSFYLLLKSERKEVLTVLIFSIGFMLILYIISLIGLHYFVSRYLLPAAYFIFVLLGLWFSKIKIRYSIFIIASYIALLSLVIPIQYSTGWNKLRNSEKYKENNLYILNAFDYTIAKYYFGPDNLILFNMENPEYNPAEWAAIGHSLNRTEDFNNIFNDKNGILISNTILLDQVRDATKDKKFDFTGLNFIETLDKIEVYNFK